MSIKGNDLQNRDFLIGFYANELLGEYRPLNKTGLVLTQKSQGERLSGQDTNHQYVYSYLVLPDNKIISYANFCTINDEQPSVAIKTAGPVLKLKINGSHTELTNYIGCEILPFEE